LRLGSTPDKARQLEFVAGLVGEDLQESAQCPAVAVKEGMKSVQLADMFGRPRRESVGRKAT
jgi:hypothetical protein